MLFSFGSVLFFSWGGNSGETGLIAIWRNPVFARACRNSRKTDREVDQKSLFIIYPFGNSSDRLPARCCTHTQAQISSSIENQDTHCINIYRRLFVDVSRKYIFIYIYIYYQILSINCMLQCWVCLTSRSLLPSKSKESIFQYQTSYLTTLLVAFFWD